ncbi:MAG: PKD domain-containing protein [Chloroflexota bacterium]|nr:PKD domain-containing protein [Chloroflexota bacterium]
MAINNVAPTVEAGENVNYVLSGSPVEFSGGFNDPGTSDTHTIEWNFGDGTPVVTDTLTPSHTYASGGDYTVTITVTDDDGGVGSDTLTVHVNDAPVADPGGPYTGDEGSPITFDGSGSYDPDGSIVSYEWNFGDGSTEVTGDESSIHAYGDNGIYTVTLTATDDEGATDAVTTTVTVNNVAPTVDAGSDVDDALVDTPISFSGSFTDPGWLDTHTIEWNFGDSSPIVTGTLSPTHAYASGGDYTVTLTVTDDDGGLGIDTATITVWNYIFIDEERGTALRINTASRTYRFLVPDYDTGIKEADCMLVIDCLFSDSQWITVADCDSNVFLTVTAYGGEKDYCIATLWDKETWKAYWLYDKWGIE